MYKRQAVIIAKKAAGLFDKLQKAIDRINVVIRENISGVRVIRAFNKEHFEEDRTRKTFESLSLIHIYAVLQICLAVILLL